MQRVNAAFAACVSDALVVMSFHALRTSEGAMGSLSKEFAV